MFTEGDINGLIADSIDKEEMLTMCSLSDKINLLREHGLYNIFFRNAGVACQFFTGALPNIDYSKDFKVYAYYNDLESSVNAEIKRLNLVQ